MFGPFSQGQRQALIVGYCRLLQLGMLQPCQQILDWDGSDESDKHCSLPVYGINYDRNFFSSACSRIQWTCHVLLSSSLTLQANQFWQLNRWKICITVKWMYSRKEKLAQPNLTYITRVVRKHALVWQLNQWKICHTSKWMYSRKEKLAQPNLTYITRVVRKHASILAA